VSLDGALSGVRCVLCVCVCVPLAEEPSQLPRGRGGECQPISPSRLDGVIFFLLFYTLSVCEFADAALSHCNGKNT